MKELSTPFHLRLKELREAHGMSYRNLQSALNKEGLAISHTSLRKWEVAEGKSRIPTEHIAALSRVFNVSPSFLLEEIFAEKPTGNKRIQSWKDVDLLTETQHSILLNLKAELLKSNDNEKPPLGQRKNGKHH